MQIRSVLQQVILVLSVALLGVAPFSATAQAPAKKEFKDPESCLECHDDMLDEKVIHQAVQDSCLDCHSGIEPNTRPHKYTGDLKYGLDAEQPKLCIGCHGKLLGKKSNVHKAIEKDGCIACHDPHSGKHKKLLKSALPALCANCHKKEGFSGAVTHKPVHEGKCADCHDNHASDLPLLLRKQPVETCLECHKEIKNQPHVVSSFTRKGHPLGDDAEQAQDPLRPGMTFYCGSCHEPHRAEFKRLLRIDPKLGMMSCQKCHEK